MIETIVLSAMLLMALFFVFTLLSHRRFRRQVEALKLLFKEQQRQIANLKTELHEIRCGALGVGTRVQEVEGKLAQAIERQDEIVSQTQYQDPQSRLYSHAMKLVERGADVDEIVHECELPRAEAELLVSLHSRQS
jgi:predicted  nucleic acid-binding Zn-ribbon protein